MMVTAIPGAGIGNAKVNSFHFSPFTPAFISTTSRQSKISQSNAADIDQVHGCLYFHILLMPFHTDRSLVVPKEKT